VTGHRLARVRRFLESAQVLGQPGHPLSRKARAQLPSATGLSPENIEWALENALEIRPSAWDLDLLCSRTPECSQAHVSLSANVFVASLRAIAIALAAAPGVTVRPSRREPLMVELLAQAAPGQFHVAEELQANPGDHYWAYGSDESLRQIRMSLPRDVVFHAHGGGYGIVAVSGTEIREEQSTRDIARAIVEDVVPFDQRGCLSPRVVLVQGSPDVARRLWHAVAIEMRNGETQIPVGDFSPEERVAIVRGRDTLCVASEVIDAGTGWVSLGTQSLPWILPPVGRILHIRSTNDSIEDARPHAAYLTTIGVNSMEASTTHQLRAAFPNARIAKLGQMQRPRLDGPVDLRNLKGEIV
jgi:hypothetical protein